MTLVLVTTQYHVLLQFTITERVTMNLIHIDNFHVDQTSHCAPQFLFQTIQVTPIRSRSPNTQYIRTHIAMPFCTPYHSLPCSISNPSNTNSAFPILCNKLLKHHAILQQPRDLSSAWRRKATPGVSRQPNVPERLSEREPST
jgi:hypothetical protein